MLENISIEDFLKLEALLTMAEIQPDTFATGGILSEPVVITGENAEPLIKPEDVDTEALIYWTKL